MQPLALAADRLPIVIRGAATQGVWRPCVAFACRRVVSHAAPGGRSGTDVVDQQTGCDGMYHWEGQWGTRRSVTCRAAPLSLRS